MTGRSEWLWRKSRTIRVCASASKPWKRKSFAWPARSTGSTGWSTELGISLPAVADPEIFHNPSCSKSRGALSILVDNGIDASVTEYLKTPPDRATLERIVQSIGDEPSALVRKDNYFKELGLAADDYITEAQVVALLLEHPKLMERPVVIVKGRGVIARPPERVLELLH